MHWITLLLWLGVCFAVDGMGGWWTAGELTGWYRSMARPEIAPPNWLLGPVWTLLYALIAIAAWLVWISPDSPSRTWGLVLFLEQLTLNLAWSRIFFRQHAIGIALMGIIALWASIGATTFVFSQISLAAAWLLAPYWAWVTFATILNAAFWRLNQSSGG